MSTAILHLRQLTVLNAAFAELARRAATDGRLCEDALQQAAMEIWEALPKRPQYCRPADGGDPSVDAARALLMRRATDRRIDRERSSARRPALSIDALSDRGTATLIDKLPDPVEGLDARISATDAKAWCTQVERMLPESQRPGWRAWLLRTHLDLDAPEIASALCVSSDAVRQRLSRSGAWIRRHAPTPPGRGVN